MNIIKLQSDADKRKGIYYEYDADATPLGEGGMGRVFKGYRHVEKTGEKSPVAIKAIYDNIPERVVERARREAEIQIENDSLIHMYGFIETVHQFENSTKTKVHYHVIMELLVGVTLEDIINGITTDHNGMQIPYAAELHTQYINNRSEAVIKIMKSVLSGLMALHDKGYIHRDIDPSNIMVTIDKKIKLIDFGICKQIVSLESMDKALTAAGVFMGKVNYAAPELVLGDVRSQSYTTDIYALGIMLYQLCTGHLPFSGTDQDILAANLRKPLPMKDVKSSSFRKVIRKATEKTQAKRYASAAEFRVDIEKLATAKDNGNNKKILIAAAGIAAAVLALCTLLLPTDNSEKTNQAKPKVQDPIKPKPVIVKLSCEELYSNALQNLNLNDTTKRAKAKEQIRTLAMDSAYTPAIIKLLNSTDSLEINTGFAKLEKMAQSKDSNTIAMFEYGLTMSKGNKTFKMPEFRQRYLGMDGPDLDKANFWLYKVMNREENNYKSAYWILDNLIEQKMDGKNTSAHDKEIVEVYYKFKKRISMFNDTVAQKYSRDIENGNEKTLRNWGLIN